MNRDMNHDLKYAQSHLTEAVIRRFWKALTRSYPALCVNDGLSIEYHQEFTLRHVHAMVDKLTRCPGANVACPLFQYDYDPPNSTPHHVTAITLTQLPGQVCILSFFDPKGRGALHKRQEFLLMKVLARAIQQKTGRKVVVNIYQGDNLQKNDTIGLCQLFSLFYLYEYVTELNGPHPPPLTTLSDPNAMVAFIRKKRRGFTNRTLFAFWNGYFQSLHQHQSGHRHGSAAMEQHPVGR